MAGKWEEVNEMDLRASGQAEMWLLLLLLSACRVSAIPPLIWTGMSKWEVLSHLLHVWTVYIYNELMAPVT